MSRNQETCDITIDGQLRVGVFPRAPVIFKLQRSLQEALGFTDFDRRMMAKRKPDDPPIEPSDEGDGFAIPQIYFAALGICWPEKIEPTFKECKHDPVEFGQVVFEHFLDHYGNKPGITGQLQDEGRRLLTDMIRHVTQRVANAVVEERGNSVDQEETTTSE